MNPKISIDLIRHRIEQSKDDFGKIKVFRKRANKWLKTMY